MSTPLGKFTFLGLLPPFLTFLALWVFPNAMPDLDMHARAMRGFANLFAAGSSAQGGYTSVFSDQAAYAAMVRGLYGRAFVEQMWGYPPSMLLVALPFSLIPIAFGFVLWTAGSIAALWRAMGFAGLSSAAAVAAISPAAFEGILNGQNGAFAAALILVGLAGIGRRPLVAGLAIGMLTLKPQLGVLIPVCLIAARDWRTSTVAVVTAAFIVAASASIFGQGAWFDFATITRPFMTSVLERPWQGLPAQVNFASPFMAARAFGAGLTAAYALQAAVSLACASAIWIAWRRKDADPAMRIILTATLTLLATPYSHSYDLVALGVGAAFIAMRTPIIHPAERAALCLAWIWPGAMVLVGVATHGSAPAFLACVSMVIVGISAWRRLGGIKETEQGILLVSNP